MDAVPLVARRGLRLWTAATLGTLWAIWFAVLVGLLPALAYLSLVDAIAIGGGTWTINPDDTLGLLLGGVLPLEEFVFFVVTNTLIVLGMVLVLARESHARSFDKGLSE